MLLIQDNMEGSWYHVICIVCNDARTSAFVHVENVSNKLFTTSRVYLYLAVRYWSSKCFNIMCVLYNVSNYCSKIVNEYDQEIPQSQTADNPVAP